MLNGFRARLARRSFDFQWAELPSGEMMLSDPWFFEHVDEIVAEHELRLPRSWFPGRRVLDAGCGNGRWIEGFVRLGCEVTAFDASTRGLQNVDRTYGDRVRTVHGDILRASETLAGEQFDLVWSWGVLHHTGDTARGVRELAALVAPDGFLYLYLYGKASVSRMAEARLAATRVLLNALPLRARRRALELVWGKEGAHQKFDLLSTAINQRYTFDEAAAMVRAAGFGNVLQTMLHTEVFLRADRGGREAAELTLPEPSRPYWFERTQLPRSAPGGPQ
jgi:SAM-dependent methyltransferase